MDSQPVTDKYQALLKATTQGFCLLQLYFDETGQRAVDFRYLEFNPAFVEHSGLPADALGKAVSELVPNLEPVWLETYGHVALTGQAEHLEYEVAALSHWYDAHAFRVGPPEARQVGVLFSDVTARKQAERRQAFLLQLSDALRPLLDPRTVQQTAMQLLGEELQVSRGLYAEVDSPVVVTQAQYVHGVTPLPARLSIADFGSAIRALHERGETLIITDAATDARLGPAERAAYQAAQIGAAVAVQLVKAGRWVASCTVHQQEPRSWTDLEVSLLHEVAERTWDAVERARAEEALRVSEQQFRMIVNLVPDLLWRSDPDSDTTWYNQRWYEYTGQTPAEAAEYGWTEVIHPDDRVESSRRYQAAVATGQPLHQEHRVRSAQGDYCWFQVQARPMLNECGAVLAWFGAATNIDERKRREQAAALLDAIGQQLSELAAPDALMRAVGERLGSFLGAAACIFADVDEARNEATIHHGWNTDGVSSLKQTFRLSEYFGEEFRRAGWAGEPSIVADTSCDPHANAEAYAALGIGAFVTLPFQRQGRWVANLTVTSREARTWHLDEIGLLQEVAARVFPRIERARAEEALSLSEARLRALIANLPGAAAFIVGPDLRYQLAGGEALDAAGFRPDDLLGRTVAEAMPPEVVPRYESHYRQALAGQHFAVEHTSHGHVYVSRGVPLLGPDGRPEAALVVSYDITERQRAEQALRASEQRLQLIADAMPALIAYLDVGLHYRFANRHYQTWFGTPPEAIIGQHLRAFLGEAVFARLRPHAEAALAGQRQTFEQPMPFRAGGTRYVHTEFVPDVQADGSVAGYYSLVIDITQRMQAEEALRNSEARLADLNATLEARVARRTHELQASRDLLQSVFDTNLIAMSVMEAVRDEAGTIQDFRLRLVSRELARETGRDDLVDKFYTQEYPGIREVGIFDLAVRALETGVPQSMEYYYPHEGFYKWFACQFVKLDDGVVATNLDITERKQAEQELRWNLHLLEQAEAVAGLGSWDYNPLTREFLWSEGMYRLFGLPPGRVVSPDIYLQFVVDEDRLQAEQLVARIGAGSGPFEETLRLRVGEQIKTMRIKAIVLYDEQERPVRVLGVDLDISELRRLEADNLRLLLTQQQALFEAVQAAQEAERKRMAESLHNGIGQILYATKLRLDRLHAPLLGTDPNLVTAHAEADRLLSEAIRQTRALSHELVPTVLEEFGLAPALQDIARKMSTPPLRLRSHLLLDEAAAPLPLPLQLALYRMAQELAQNIVKHARGATEASLELETMPGWVLLRAEDNGPGFPHVPTSPPGLGLRSIRDRVSLLGGHLESGSLSTGGAYVRIRLPFPTLPSP